MPGQTDLFPHLSNQSVESSGTDTDHEKQIVTSLTNNNAHSSNGSTGNQIGGQSPYSEDELHGRVEGLPKE